MQPTLQELSKALHASWSADTAYNSNDWSKGNIARGQCVISCLIVQDYFGGELIGYKVEGDGLDETHYMNQLTDGTVIDTTASQYKTAISMRRKPANTGDFASVRAKRLADPSTAARYYILKGRVEQQLAHGRAN